MNWARWLNLKVVVELPEPDIEKEPRKYVSQEWPPKYWLHEMGNKIIQELKNYHKERRKNITPEWPNELRWKPEPCPYCGIRLDYCNCSYNYPDNCTRRI